MEFEKNKKYRIKNGTSYAVPALGEPGTFYYYNSIENVLVTYSEMKIIN